MAPGVIWPFFAVSCRFSHLAYALLNEGYQRRATGSRRQGMETTMFSFDRFNQVAASAAAALLLSTLSIAAAVGPAHAASTAPVAVAASHSLVAHG